MDSITLEHIPRTIAAHLQNDELYIAMVDQRQLPSKVVFIDTCHWAEIVDAIKTLALRGAPAIGVAGAAALGLWALATSKKTEDALASAAQVITKARPTAVNLAWGVEQMYNTLCKNNWTACNHQQLQSMVYEQLIAMEQADEAANRAIGAWGAELLPYNAQILTHCNAGSLATVFYGTALGVIYTAAAQGKIARVWADETRPVGQGARLTVWELSQAGIPVTLECDNMAASLMASGQIDAVIVGADRIAANGDTANKIGTYGLAVLAQYHGIPFYVAAPTSTVDQSIPNGDSIPIEERDPQEVLASPIPGVDVWNPAFDVTPASLITAWITEKGVYTSHGC